MSLHRIQWRGNTDLVWLADSLLPRTEPNSKGTHWSYGETWEYHLKGQIRIIVFRGFNLKIENCELRIGNKFETIFLGRSRGQTQVDSGLDDKTVAVGDTFLNDTRSWLLFPWTLILLYYCCIKWWTNHHSNGMWPFCFNPPLPLLPFLVVPLLHLGVEIPISPQTALVCLVPLELNFFTKLHKSRRRRWRRWNTQGEFSDDNNEDKKTRRCGPVESDPLWTMEIIFKEYFISRPFKVTVSSRPHQNLSEN